MATSVLTGVIDSDGKISVPAEVREQLGLKVGDTVEVTIKIAPDATPEEEFNPFDEYIGALPAFANIEEVNAYYRDLRGGDLEND
jgi:AbrB family looped-hinge helix DNA binding protein